MGFCPVLLEPWTNQLLISYNDNKRKAEAAPKAPGNPCNRFQQDMRYPRLPQTYWSSN